MKIEVIRVGEPVVLQANPPITQFKFGNRSAETMLNVRDGETIVLGGLIQEEDRRTRVTVPWLGDLPFIGNLISSFKTQRVTTEVILTLTPHIVQAMTPPSLSRQAFWSGTDSTYSNSTMFTPHPKTAVTKVTGANASSAQPSATVQRGVAGKASSASLARMLTVGPVASVTPNDSVVEVGKEIKIAIHDERLRPDKDTVFHLQYDPNVLDLKALADAEVIQSDPGDPSSALAEAIVIFRVGAAAPHGSNQPATNQSAFMSMALNIMNVKAVSTPPPSAMST